VNFVGYRAILYEAAERVSGAKALPVSVREVCAYFGVPIRRSEATRKAALIHPETAPEILLPKSPSTILPRSWPTLPYNLNGNDSERCREAWDRYLVAHELGHLLLFRAGVGRPFGRGEYYLHEELCDSFARWLLLPEHLAQELTRPLPCNWTQATEALEISFRVVAKMESRAFVPWILAAFRASDCSPSFGFLLLTQAESQYRVRITTLPNKRAIGTRIPLRSRLGQELRLLRHGDIRPLAPELLIEFPSLANVTAVAAERVGRGLRIALAL
jgi:hypothetical protein